MHNWTEYRESSSKASGSLWQYYRDKPFIDVDGNITDIPNDSDTTSFNYKRKITGQTGNNRKKICWNNGTFKIFKQFLEKSWNSIN